MQSKYIVERDCALRAYEFHREDDSPDGIGIVAGGIVKGEDVHNLRDLTTLLLTDNFLRWLKHSGILDTYK